MGDRIDLVIDTFDSGRYDNKGGIVKKSGADWTSTTSYMPFQHQETKQFNLGPDK